MADIPLSDNEREYPNEYTEVERPLLEQLGAMGWDYVQGDIDYPEKTFRERFRDVLLRPKLRQAIRRINRDEHGDEFLDDVTVERAIHELERTTQHSLLGKNQELTEKLITGVHVERAEGSHEAGQRLQHVKFIEFDAEHADRNDFLAINQFRVDFVGRTGFVIPDIVLFVNGIPLAVAECKSPSIAEPMQEGINQLLRYSNNRPEVEEPEGVEHLFLFNQLMVTTWFYEARVATLGAGYKHYQEWKDTHPVPEARVREELAKPEGKLKSQEVLAAGMLRPCHLLDLVRNFVLFTEDDEGRPIKVVARYQQFRAVHKGVEGLLTNRSKLEGAAEDERSGIIWHTQGSGKSFTMVFLVRKMRALPELQAFKVVAVTDRTQLERQLHATARLTGEVVRPNDRDRKAGESASDCVKRILAEEGPDLVFCMIQKQQDFDAATEVLEFDVPAPPVRTALPAAEEREGYIVRAPEKGPGRQADLEADEPAGQTASRERGNVIRMRETIRDFDRYPVLNESDRILLLIDECHRSQGKTLHANLMKALPNAAKIGFTGTPVTRSTAAGTLSIFRRFIDKYPLQQAVDDESTVRILYEGRVPLGMVERAEELDQAASIEFAEYTESEQQFIMQKYATQKRVLEAPKLIAAKARDMLCHYVSRILPDGFKAQVVATSRLAAVRYQQALAEACCELVGELEALDPALLALDDEGLEAQGPETQLLVRVHPWLDRIRVLEFAAVISHDHNDPPSWRQWSDKTQHEELERRFKLPFAHSDPEKRSSLAFLCVQNMLLTGFDAPIEQVMYLDRAMYEHELLQAIARVNRKRDGKACGYVVDYVGIAQALHDALQGIDDETLDGGDPENVRDEIPRLEARHARVMDVFASRGIADIRDIEACVDLLADVEIRADFINKLRDFLISLGIVMPRPEALPYLRDAKILGFIAKVAANLYRDGQLNLLGVEIKVRQLIDQYIVAQGIDPKIPPIEITDVGFEEHVRSRRSSRTRASEMLHALRHHIRIHLNDDPEFFRTMSEKLEEILQELKDNWEELERVLTRFIGEEVARGRREEVAGLDPKVQAPFFGILKERLEAQLGEDLATDSPQFSALVQLTIGLVAHIQSVIRTVDFWRDEVSRRQLETWVYNSIRRCRLDGSRLFDGEGVRELATQVIDLARHRHRWLVQ